MKKKFIAMLLVAFMVMGLSASSYAAVNMVAVAGSPGGGWFALMARIAEIIQTNNPDINPKSVPGSGFANPVSVAQNKAQLGFAFPPNIRGAREGTGEYKTRGDNSKIRAIAGGFGASVMQWVASKEFVDKYQVKTLEDIAKKKVPVRIVTDIAGTTDEIWGRMIMESYGITYDNIKKWGGSVKLAGYSDHIQLLQDGHADISISNCDFPAAMYQEIGLNVPIKYIHVGEKGINMLIKQFSHTPVVIPAGTYKGIDYDYPTAGVPTTIITNSDVPEDVVYRITKTIVEHADEINKALVGSGFRYKPKEGWKYLGTELHSGAEKYYREVGIIK